MMLRPSSPPDEQARLAALTALGILDTEPEERFDRITRIATRLFQVPICLISLVDEDRQWFKSRQGLDATETPRDISFCAHTILDSEPLVVEDTLADPRFRDNPLVVGDPRIRFYAGHPLCAMNGSRVGTLCLADRRPRHFDESEIALLADLSAMVESELNSIQLAELQREMHTAQEELKRFFSLSLDMLCIATFDGYFKKLNPAWSRILGFSIEELCEKPFVEFVHPEDRERTIQEAQKLVDGGYLTVSFENRYRCKDGSYKHVLWSSVPDPETRLLFAVARDITSLRTAEERLRRAVQMAEQANEAKSRFLANMSHEFRTPLNSVIGFSNVLIKKSGLTEEQEVLIKRILANGEHLLDLVNSVLDLSKIEAGKTELTYEETSLRDLVESVAEQLEVQAKTKGIHLETEIPDALPRISTDSRKLRQILINLVGNAVKFTERGSVSVRVRCDRTRGHDLQLEIVDTGIGIPEEHQGSIFEAFKQMDSSASREYGGTGLGLTICKSLCDLMGYRLDLESKPGEGTTVRVHLSAPGSLAGSL
jgi:PAS domain S-box-containing protein